MSSKPKKEKDTYAFLPIVYELLKKVTSAETTDKDIANITNQFIAKMSEAQKCLQATPGLELTEEEQLHKIKELEEMIKQKQLLIDECTKSLQEWSNEGV